MMTIQDKAKETVAKLSDSDVSTIVACALDNQLFEALIQSDNQNENILALYSMDNAIMNEIERLSYLR